jgi:hypothetical protein
MTDSPNVTIPILKLSIRSDAFYRDVAIHLTGRAFFLMVWLGLGCILLYEIVSLFMLFLMHRYHHQTSTTSAAINRTEESLDEDQGNGAITVEPLPLIPSRKQEHKEPNRLIVLLWGVSTAYAIFYSFEMFFLYVNDRWYQLMAIQVLLTLTDVFTWVRLVLVCKYGMRCSFSGTQVCCGIKLLHLIFNLMVESRESITSGRHWMFLLEDSTYLWCAQFWIAAQPRKVVTTVKGMALLLLSAASCALLICNLTSMNRITRL